MAMENPLMRSANRCWGNQEDYDDPSYKKPSLSETLRFKPGRRPLAREHTRKAWEEQYGKPLYSPRYHAKVKLKRKRVQRLIQKYIAAAVAEYPEGLDEGFDLESLRQDGITPVADAVAAIDKCKQCSICCCGHRA